MNFIIRKRSLEIISILLSTIVIIPLYLVFINSMKTTAEASQMSLTLPKIWSVVENYTTVFREANISLALWNSTLVTMFSVIGLILLGSTTAFVVHRRTGRMSTFLRLFLLCGMILPISIIPTYVLMHNLVLTNSHFGAILLYVATHFAQTAFLYLGFFKGLPRDIDEAAFIDGASGFKFFFKIIFPLLLPVNATVLIIQFMGVWNDFKIAVYFLSKSELQTLTLTIFYFFGENSNDWNLIFADIILISLPVIVLYIFLQRYIVSGLTAGAVKY